MLDFLSSPAEGATLPPAAEGPEPPDLLTQILLGLRLDGVEYGRCVMHAPWAVAFPALPSARFHFVGSGGAWLRTRSADWQRLHPGDAVLLAKHFLARHAAEMNPVVKGFAPDALKMLDAWHWPGNVRELENVMQRALVMARGVELQVADLNLPRCHPQAAAICASLLKQSKQNAEFDYILDLLQKFNGHRTRTAEALGVSTRALRYKLAAMREHGVDIDALAS